MNFSQYLKIENIEEIPFSKVDFEDMVRRVFNKNRQALKEYGYNTWIDWLNKDTAYNVSIALESESDIYKLYLQELPEDIRAIDLIEAYKLNKLKNIPKIKQSIQTSIEPTGKYNDVPWASQPKKAYSTQELKDIYNKAINKDLEARKSLFLLFNSESNLAEKLGIPKTELTKKIRQYAGFTNKARDLQKALNYNVPEESQWMGIENASFLGELKLSHEDLEKFIKGIEITNEGEWYHGKSGGNFRQYIVKSFLSIDSGIKYTDLGFKLGKCYTDEELEAKGRKYQPKGLYSHKNKLITVSDVSLNTVAHEIGHYLDFLFEEEIVGLVVTKYGLSRNDYISSNNKHLSKIVPLPRLQWADKYKLFLRQIIGKSDLSSEYTQDFAEVFARFIDYFVNWTNKVAGRFTFVNHYGDKFDEGDCRVWVKLLQEHNYLNAKFPPSSYLNKKKNTI